LESSRRAEAIVFGTRFSLEEHNVDLSFHEALYASSSWRTANPLQKEVRRLSIVRLSVWECKFQPTAQRGETDPPAFCLFRTTLFRRVLFLDDYMPTVDDGTGPGNPEPPGKRL
jgi:hypothetical protein